MDGTNLQSQPIATTLSPTRCESCYGAETDEKQWVDYHNNKKISLNKLILIKK